MSFFEDDFAYVYGAASVKKQDGVYSIVTEDAPAGAILSFEYDGIVSPEIFPVVQDENTYTIQTVEAGLIQLGALRAVKSGEHEISFVRDWSSIIEGLEGSVSVKVSDIQIEKKFIGIQKYFVLTGVLDFAINLELTIAEVSVPVPMGSIQIGTVGCIGLALNLDASAKLAFTSKYTFRIGLDYCLGEITLIKQMRIQGSSLSVEGEASLTVGLNARLDFGANGHAKASFGIGPKAKVTYNRYISGTPATCLNIAAYLYLGLEIEAKIKEIITSATLIDYKYEYEIWGEKNSPLKFVEHREDGITVDACTREHDTGTHSDGYFVPKYTTPADSRRYASSNPNAGSSGRGANGNTFTIWETSDNGDGTVTITGYNGNASVLFIPNTIDGKTVSVIGADAFKGNTALVSVTIPETVEKIGSGAFRNCTSLSSVMINGTYLTTTGYTDLYHYGIFTGCSSLQTVQLMNGIQKIPAGMFYYAPIRTFEIPSSVTSIETDAFCHSSLESIQLPAGITGI
ncbi:MAG: leucine-rich repeat domain-containing protein, partial [Lachnospiraceae bacterium]|nr:leucine-rich repeat domain-containing protein [Lachnospiraceae bacterium]